MLRLLVERGVLFAAPFAVFLIWREVARRQGRTMGSTPWAWLTGAGAVLVGLSLIAGALVQDDHRGEVYVPAEATPGGFVPGHYEKQP